MQTAHLLQQRGLTAAEADVYITVLELGSVPVATVARRLGRNRVTVYSILQKLLTKGIAYSAAKKKTNYYSVISPTQMQHKLQHKLEQFTAALPQLQALSHKLDTKPSVQYFEGVAGIISIYDDVLTSQTPLRMIMGIDYIHPAIQQYIDQTFLPARVVAGLSVRVIAPQTDAMVAYTPHDQDFLREMKLVSTDRLQFTNETIIYDDHKLAICLFAQDECSGLIVHSKSLAQSQVGIFDLLWDALP